MSRPIIIDCSSLRLSLDEKSLFSEIKPFGFILFKRNCESPDQVRALTDDFREITNNPDIPILIDQEGGRVARLRPPHWRDVPSAEVFARLYEKDKELGLKAARINALIMASELEVLGINVNCAPVVDLLYDGAHLIVGDRSYGKDIRQVTDIARAVGEGFMAGGITPIIKHIPGHGRAMLDSHYDLPIIDTDFDELNKSCFEPFRALNDFPAAMTAHIIYSKIDPDYPATLSKKLIKDVIRKKIGFKSVLISDDVSMKALKGSALDNAAASLNAGCDLALYCNAELKDREIVLKGLEAMDGEQSQKILKKLVPFKVSDNVNIKELQMWLDDTLKLIQIK